MTKVSRELAGQLLADLLDLREPSALDVQRAHTGMRELWCCEANETNALFRHAWERVWGISPSRLDFLEFWDFLESDGGTSAERFVEFLTRRTSLGLLTHFKDSTWTQRVREAVDSYRHPPYEDEGRRAWISKLCERYGGDPPDAFREAPISDLHQWLVQRHGPRDGDPFWNPFTGSRQPAHRRSEAVAGVACTRLDAAKYASVRDGSMLLRVLQAPAFGCVLYDDAQRALWGASSASSTKSAWWMVERALGEAFPLLPGPLGARRGRKYGIADHALKDEVSATVVPLPKSDGSKSWTRALCAKLVRDGADGKARDPGTLAHLEYLVRSVDRAGGDAFCYDVASPGQHARAVLIVDNRENPLVLAALAVTLSNLAPREWGLCVCCSPASAAFYRRHVGEMVSDPQAVVHLVIDELSAPGFDAVAYSEVLKGRRFWDRIPFQKVLLIQDDSAIARKGLEASGLLEYDYVGAPWAVDPALVPYVGNSFVGNGGLSIRDVGRMAAVAEADADGASTLFANGIQVLPEDVFFGGGVARDPGARACPESAAEGFACEMRSLVPYLAGRRPMPFGFHKIWPYHPIDQVRAFFKKYLE